MKKRFKSKNKSKKSKAIFLLVLLILAIYTFAYIKTMLKNTKPNYLSYLIKESFNNQIDYKTFNNPLDVFTATIDQSTKLSTPKVYIYNTHDEENYASEKINPYNITPSIKLMSYYLAENLNNKELQTIVEPASIKDILTKNNWIYKKSYEASRILLDQSIKDNPSLKFFIDLHRDSSVKEKTTTIINDQEVAKILFIIGLDNPNYEKNLAITTNLEAKIKEKYPELLRGILKKQGAGVNGIYNQDFNEFTILIELGGQYNTIKEAANTIDLIAPILADYIKEII